MDEYSDSYRTLFREVTRAIDELNASNYGLAKDILVNAQCEAGRAFIEFEDEAERL